MEECEVQTDNRHICRGRKCSLPRIMKSAATLPKRERKIRAETIFRENNFDSQKSFFTRSAGTLTISC